MDGARYHMCREGPLPKSTWKVEQVKSWYVLEGIPFPARRPGCSAVTKKELVDHANSREFKKRYVRYPTYDIAQSFGHEAFSAFCTFV